MGIYKTVVDENKEKKVTAPAASARNTVSAQGMGAAGQGGYRPFQQSQATTDAANRRQQVATQKPGEFNYAPYQKSDAVTQAEALLAQQLGKKPGEYQSAWQTQLDDTLGKILSREKFSYDLNEDALYQQMRDQYMLQGQQAMMDAMGQAQAMTGGYGNSYAQSVGQQTYQGYLQQLTDRVPEYYQMALDQYNREGEDLYNQYGLYADRDALDYGRYRDLVGDYYTELDRLTQDARYQSEQDYGRYTDNRDFDYGQHRDQISDDRYLQELYYQMERDKVTDQRYENEWNYQLERDKTSDQQWQTEFDENKRRWDQEHPVEESKGTSGDGTPRVGGYFYDGWSQADWASYFNNYFAEHGSANGNAKIDSLIAQNPALASLISVYKKSAKDANTGSGGGPGMQEKPRQKYSYK